MEGLEGVGSGVGLIVWSYFYEEVRVVIISYIFLDIWYFSLKFLIVVNLLLLFLIKC